jgi:hypothetical protein
MRTRRRIHPYIRPELAQRLVAYCAAKGITESSAVETAVEDHLTAGERDNAIILRRLDRLARATGRVQRDLDVLSEGLSVAIETWFNTAPERTAEEVAGGKRSPHSAIRSSSISWPRESTAAHACRPKSNRNYPTTIRPRVPRTLDR